MNIPAATRHTDHATTETATAHITAISDLMGFTQAQKRRYMNMSTHTLITSGFSGKAVGHVCKALDVSITDFADVLGIAARTYHNLLTQENIGVQNSDRLYRIAATTALATGVFGTRERAKEWMHTPLQALAFDTPLARLKTEAGNRRVEELLSAIEYGVYV